MGNIVLLDDLTINKIAAGEVIERPASVVKEMVENSIDAGADHITVEIEKGGISLIRITDNGCGIQGDDLEIAFERHATSKIREANDLQTVKTMGFRGEALASIAAISRVEVISRSLKEDIGHRIVVEGGNIIEKEEIAAPAGTSITVKNLFFNTPVRYKFLKKDYTEAGYIEDAITRLALVNQSIAFKLINSGKRIIQTPGKGADNKSIVYSIYGKDIANSVVDVNYEYEGIKITGVIGKPEIARSNRANQLFFVNNRYIKDKNLTAAAEQAFKGLIPIGKFGFLILNLDMDPEKVDVNVHPAKLEVRFVEESKVFKSVYHAIKDSLLKSELVENVDRIDEEFYEEKEIVTDKKKNKFEDDEENNTLKDVYEFRQGLKKIGVSPIATASMNADVVMQLEKKNEEASEINLNKEENTAKEDSVAYESNVSSLDDFDYNKYSKEELEQKVEDYINRYRNEKRARENREIENNIFQEELNKGVELVVEEQKENVEMLLENNTETVEEDVTQFSENKEIIEEQNETESLEKEVNSIIEGIMKNINEQINVNNEEANNKIDENVSSEVKKEENTYNNSAETIVNIETIKNIENENKESANLVEADNQETAIINKDLNTDNFKQESKKEISSLTSNYNDADTRRIVEKLVKQKLNSKQDTQIIDTQEVRAALRKSDFNEMYQKTFGKLPVGSELKENENIEPNQDNLTVFEEEQDFSNIQYKFIGIAFKTYIIIEINDEMYMIDQHAAHERIMYEKVKENYYSVEEKDSQLMLIPDVITLTHKEAMKVKENLEMFEKAGFMLEEFGENTIKLTGVPERCMELNTKQLFLDILDEIDTTNYTARKEIEERFIATVACKSAVKAHMALDEREVDSLMQTLLALPNPFTCPHGRPTAIKMTKKEIEKKFSRRK